MGQVYAKLSMGQSGVYGILKIVDVVASGFAAIAIIDPGVCVLMHEQRDANSCEVGEAFVSVAVPP